MEERAIVKRLEVIEKALGEISEKIKRIESKEDIKRIEERLAVVEDLCLLTRLECLKTRELLKKTAVTGITDTLQSRIDYLEEVVSTLLKKVGGYGKGARKDKGKG